MKNYYLIYQITNTINGKIYIGKHKTQDINDGYMGSGKILHRAIKKHGIENFKKEILFECQSEEEMNAKEAELVNEEFLKRNDVYNLKIGGKGGWDYTNKLYNENPDKRRNAHIKAGKTFSKLCKNDPQFREHLSNALKKKYKNHPEFKERISEGLKKRWKEHGHPWIGRKMTEEHKQHISQNNSENHLGEKNSMFGKIWIYNLELKQSKTINKNEEIPEGWKIGRVLNWENQEKILLKQKQIEESKTSFENRLHELYAIYLNVGKDWDKFILETGYDKSKQNLLHQFQRLPEFVPIRNRKKKDK